MKQKERLRYLIQHLLEENAAYEYAVIPDSVQEQKRLLRSLMNVRPPGPAAAEFLNIQDEYLTEETRRKGVVPMSSLKPVKEGICLWKGDITTLAADAIVNAANCALRGCFVPCHSCVDNIIHSASGIQLRLACDALMLEQGHDEPEGSAKITPAFNLPCSYVLHTVGPIVSGELTERHRRQLASCYASCLKLADEHDMKSLAFCCISTGEFHFPQREAAQIAVRTVTDYLGGSTGIEKVVFDVYKEEDYEIYRSILESNRNSERTVM